ncbi:hypothetical protein ACIP88_14805 [Streptomyces uncialis]|uniref:golvesin C-terminal-like domain-containing protein n=1 Tax=Streptomyces uncialis TaxID=1048205 RepID=UPI003828CC6B
MSRRKRTTALGVLAIAVAAGLIQAPATTAAPQKAPAAPKPKPTTSSSVPADQRDDLLGDDHRTSGDIAWTTASDAQGFHLLTATEKSGYSWTTLASLAEPGFDADQWIGNVCVTGSGKRAVVVYAPRAFTNKPKLMARGGFTAVVDLATGETRKLKVNASLSYYNPGCGTGEDAVLTQSPGEDKRETRLIRVDAATGEVAKPVTVKGQITSSVPADGGTIAAASGRSLVEISARGAVKRLSTLETVPYRITRDADGGYVFLERDQRDTLKQARTAKVRRYADRGLSTLGQGALDDTGLTRRAGQVYVTGEQVSTGELPRTVTALKGTNKDTVLSTRGALMVERTTWADGKGSPKYLHPDKATDARAVTIEATVRDGSRADLDFTLEPLQRTAAEWDTSRVASPLLPRAGRGGGEGPAAQRSGAGLQALAGTRTEIVESERTCSVPRNDPRNQAMQPKPRQVEWAVNKAITGKLNIGGSRPANWKNLGMPAYAPQTLFANPALEGGGRVPAQVMLGITAQESNMWQAARSSVPGVTGSPLIGNYYGVDYYDANPDNDWWVDWSEADCGYGVTQVTDHMRMAGRENNKGGTAWPYEKQRAVALDYSANVAAGLQILVSKWNQTKQAGLVVHNGDPTRLENWFFALWAYNSGFYENVNANGPWGVGWANNPANPEWDAGRDPFMEDRLGNEDAADAARPQHWPYPEKVLGFAAHPPAFLESPGTMVPAFRAAWWNGTGEDATVIGSAKYNRARVKPPEDLFCGVYNWCDPTKISDGATNEPGQGPCTRTDFKCWFHQSVSWKTDCAYSCGNEFFRFTSPGYDAEEADGTAYAPNCTRTGLPTGAMIIDNQPAGTPSIRPGCPNSAWTNEGDFSIDFGESEAAIGWDGTTVTTSWPSKIDLHQLGAGFGGHFYFGHTRQNDAKGKKLEMNASWKLNKAVNGPARIWVHLPDHGAHTKYATYRVETKHGTKTRVVSQPGSGNRWVSIGAFVFDAAPVVRLSTITRDGTGDQDIAFDAVAVQPVTGQYVKDTVDAVAFFDENQNVDADPASTLFLNTPFKDRQALYDWAIKTSKDVQDLPTCIDLPAPTCVGAETKAAMSRWNTWVRESGTHPIDHPQGKSIPAWMHYSNRYQDRPGQTKPAHFDTDDSSYKIKSKATVSYIAAPDGSVIEGSEEVAYDSRTADTHLPNFVKETFRAIQQDYSINPPNLNYSAQDLNEHDGRTTTTNTNTTGIIPGRAYAPVGRKPQITNTDGYAASGASGQCVGATYTSGGSIGYRPMLGVAANDSAVAGWRDQAGVSGTVVATPVRKLMGEIYNSFFKSGLTGSIFNQSPPIWQELNFISCSDGTIRKRYGNSTGSAILRSSHMPNQYLYRNGASMGLNGVTLPSSLPVITGDFTAFSRVVTLDAADTPYSQCGQTTGRGGNPWGIDPTSSAGTNPAGRNCFDLSTGDPEYNVG